MSGMTGKLITLYGINNIGKSTHAKLLVEHLEKAGHKAKYIKYPVYDLEPSGPFLNKIMRSSEQEISEDELQLWFILNRYQYESTLKKLLDEGYIVVAEDYIGTGLAWGTTKGLPLEWLEEMNKFLLKEDLAILMEGDRSIKAKEDVHLHEQNDDLIEKCAKIHSELGSRYHWKKIKIQPQKEDTANLIWKIVENWLG